MKKTDYLGLNIAKRQDFADIEKVSDNFTVIDREAVKTNNNTGVVKEALSTMSKETYFTDTVTGKKYKMEVSNGKLLLYETKINNIAVLADKIVTNPVPDTGTEYYVAISPATYEAEQPYRYANYTVIEEETE